LKIGLCTSAKKQVFGSAQLLAGMGCHTFAFLRWHFPYFLLCLYAAKTSFSLYRFIFFGLLVTVECSGSKGLRAHTCQATQKFMRGKILEYTGEPYCPLNFVSVSLGLLHSIHTLFKLSS
jgi:hypothetical protein